MEPQPSDSLLVSRIADDGDERAFRLLFQRHSGALAAFLRRAANAAGAEVDDLVQETWVRAARMLGGFRGDAAFRTWLLGIGYNVAREGRRRAELIELSTEVPAGDAGPFEERIDLERAIARLPAGYRTVLVMHDLHGFKHEEIAAALGITEGTSKSQLARARKAVRTTIGLEYLSINR